MMLSPTIEEHNIKQAMVNELNFLSREANKAGTKSIGGVESIKDFFERQQQRFCKYLLCIEHL